MPPSARAAEVTLLLAHPEPYCGAFWVRRVCRVEHEPASLLGKLLGMRTLSLSPLFMIYSTTLGSSHQACWVGVRARTLVHLRYSFLLGLGVIAMGPWYGTVVHLA